MDVNAPFVSLVQESQEVQAADNKQEDTQTSSDGDQFNSFLFWREPPPTVDDGLLDLLVSSTGFLFRWRPGL